jgi:putative DNA methylase
MERRHIEESLPIKQIGHNSKKEDGIKKGHIRSIHKWWARRPLSASRATVFASLIEYIPKNNLNEFIDKLSQIENLDNQIVIKNAREKILKYNNGKSPKILDPFAGGGSIPLESLRLGCNTHALDYNPVAILIQFCSLVYPNSFTAKDGIMSGLPFEIEKWGDWVLSKAKIELDGIYPQPKNSNLVGYLWTRIITCENPKCKADIPLFKTFWISQKKGIMFKPIRDNKKIVLKIIDSNHEKIPENFDPKEGNIAKSVRCFSCPTTIDNKTVRKLYQESKFTEKIAIKFLSDINGRNKKYEIADENDQITYDACKELLENKIKKLKKEWTIEPIPFEETPKAKGRGAERAFSLRNYGQNTWGDVFNIRQKLVLLTFTEQIQNAYKQMILEGYDEDSAKIITTYLGLNLSNLARIQSVLTRYRSDTGSFEKVFSQSAIEMIHDYGEVNSFRGKSEWSKGILSISRSVTHCLKINNKMIKVSIGSATKLPYEDGYFDAVITDPPYYDNVPYSYFSDFFYVWLKRSIGFLYPELFSTPLTPKTDEIVVYSDREGGFKGGEIFFENMLQKSFKEIYRVLKLEGIAIIVYAHKSTDGWEKLIHSILNSGLVVTAAWPIRTELKGRRRSIKAASLASSIYMVARKWKKEEIGFYRNVKKELKQYLNKKLEQYWKEEIIGADFFISSIGSAIEVFGKYEKVIDDNDKPISVSKLLEDTREIVTNYAINKVIKGEFSDNISQMTRFYILWRWAYGEAKVPFDSALKMAQSVGMDLEHEWNKGFIVKEKEFIRVLGPDERNDDLNDPQDLIDILHKMLQIWTTGKINDVDKFLEEKGYKNSEVFKRVAQAISESLPLESTEKKWLDGFLTGFKSDDSQSGTQSKLTFEEGK